MADSENTRTLPAGRLTRRTLLSTAGLAATAGAISAPGLTFATGAGPDADLLALDTERSRIAAALLTHAGQEPANDRAEWERAEKAMVAERWRIENAIAEAEACTFAGLLVKARIAADNIEEPKYGDEINCLALLRDLERIVGKGRA